MDRKRYTTPGIISETSFETSALGCGKTSNPPPGSWHFDHAYDTFTGHFGSGFGESASMSGTVGVGPGAGTSLNYGYSGLCGNWVTFTT